MDFERVGELTDIETIAAGRGIRDLPRLAFVWQGLLEDDERQHDVRLTTE
jgi:hypothetical protein